MKRIVNNTLKCIDCGSSVPRKVKRCPECNQKFLMIRPTYVRNPEHREKMSFALSGKPKNYQSASNRPEVAEKIRQSWTEEKREAARQRGLKFSQDPDWRLNCGLPGEQNPMWENGRSLIPYARGWTRKAKQIAWERANGKCEICGSANPIDTHHIDFQKNNHNSDNLTILCRKCHKKLHAEHMKNNKSLQK